MFGGWNLHKLFRLHLHAHWVLNQAGICMANVFQKMYDTTPWTGAYLKWDQNLWSPTNWFFGSNHSVWWASLPILTIRHSSDCLQYIYSILDAVWFLLWVCQLLANQNICRPFNQSVRKYCTITFWLFFVKALLCLAGFLCWVCYCGGSAHIFIWCQLFQGSTIMSDQETVLKFPFDIILVSEPVS